MAFIQRHTPCGITVVCIVHLPDAVLVQRSAPLPCGPSELSIVTKNWQLQPSLPAALICLDRQMGRQLCPDRTANIRAHGKIVTL